MTWDLSDYFPKFDGPEMRAFKKQVETDLAALGKRAAKLAALTEANAGTWERLVVDFENVACRMSHLGSYIGCLTATHGDRPEYHQAEAAMALLGAELNKLQVEFLRVLKPVSDRQFKAFCRRPRLAGLEYFLTRIRTEARFTMSPAEERLAADLDVDGMDAWGRLYDLLTGKLEFELRRPDGTVERRPMSQRRSLMEDADPALRQAAFECGNEAWRQHEDVLAAALNHITGTRLVLYRHRGIDDVLAPALRDAGIGRATLDAMMAAITAARPFTRKLVEAKAASLGIPVLSWQDMDAALPLPDVERFTWPQGVELVRSAFARSYPKLAEYFDQALAKRWIESEQRPGKRPGAFCTGSRLIRQSRVFMTFLGSLGDVGTLAHEVGHAFHSHVMREVRPFACHYPMTLAETASTFGEAILKAGLVADPKLPAPMKAELLNLEVANGIAFLLNIPVRFDFERALYAERAKGEVAVERLKELMVAAQRAWFGKTLAGDGVDPYFWASKLHFFLTGISFYNFPYSFGYLLSRGLFAMFQREGAKFLPKYERFLELSGSMPAEEVAREALGIDLTQTAFWRTAIDSLKQPLADFRALLPDIRAWSARGRKPVATARRRG